MLMSLHGHMMQHLVQVTVRLLFSKRQLSRDPSYMETSYVDVLGSDHTSTRGCSTYIAMCLLTRFADLLVCRQDANDQDRGAE